jgi:hypothetical protein
MRSPLRTSTRSGALRAIVFGSTPPSSTRSSILDGAVVRASPHLRAESAFTR